MIEIKKEDNINHYLELDKKIIKNLNLTQKEINNHFNEIFDKKCIYILNYLNGGKIVSSFRLFLGIIENGISIIAIQKKVLLVLLFYH